MESLPKKILIIKDCTFILPDDFEGTTEDAFREFLDYEKTHAEKAKIGDGIGLFSTFNMLVHGDGSARTCGEYAILELINGEYHIKTNNKK